MSEAAKQLAKMLEKSKRTVFFGGAGVSTESGIPDFRSAHGLYGGAKGKSYEDMLHIRYFLTSPDEFWAFYKNVMLYPDARPNAAHIALARLEAAGKLDCVLTQNIDGLHQAAGSRNCTAPCTATPACAAGGSLTLRGCCRRRARRTAPAGGWCGRMWCSTASRWTMRCWKPPCAPCGAVIC